MLLTPIYLLVAIMVGCASQHNTCKSTSPPCRWSGVGGWMGRWVDGGVTSVGSAVRSRDFRVGRVG